MPTHTIYYRRLVEGEITVDAPTIGDALKQAKLFRQLDPTTEQTVEDEIEYRVPPRGERRRLERVK